MRALEQGHDYLAAQIGEMVVEMRSIRAEIPGLMADGIRAAVGDPETWAAARRGMSQQAQNAAGGWVLGMLRFAIDKALWAIIAVIAIYWAGGLPALLALLKLKAVDK